MDNMVNRRLRNEVPVAYYVAPDYIGEGKQYENAYLLFAPCHSLDTATVQSEMAFVGNSVATHCSNVSFALLFDIRSDVGRMAFLVFNHSIFSPQLVNKN